MFKFIMNGTKRKMENVVLVYWPTTTVVQRTDRPSLVHQIVKGLKFNDTIFGPRG